MACQWASISPGISVRPLPAITVTPGSAAIGSVEMRSMILPLISTLDGVESEASLPSKMRTFSNNVAPASFWRVALRVSGGRKPNGHKRKRGGDNPS